jgi:hypothetical protein
LKKKQWIKKELQKEHVCTTILFSLSFTCSEVIFTRKSQPLFFFLDDADFENRTLKEFKRNKRWADFEHFAIVCL